MFIYLSKKIAIPHNTKLQCVSWNSEQGWIACGGANGLLKVLKLEGKKNGAAAKKKLLGSGGADQPKSPTSQAGPDEGANAAAGGSNLTMNQTLEGHNGSVVCLTWNENYRKLTTSDQNGLIIVWMLHKGMWFEEMINNRNKSVVKDMKWTADGQKICIVYEDGAVIVGSVDGNRLWGKELDIELNYVEWSPDGRNILFGTLNTNEVHLYDNLGNFLTKLPIYAVASGSTTRLIGIHWYNGLSGYIEQNCPSLAIAFENGRVQIMRDDVDDNPILIDTGITINKIQWNTLGSVLAISGVKTNEGVSGPGKETQMVQFYSPHGKHLRTLKVPGNSGINGISWEGGSLRLALAVDSYIYFANIRPDYEWGYFSNTLVYSFNKPDRTENCVCFWDVVTDERHIKYVKSLISIRASSENCVFATKTDDGSGQYILILCNAIGSPVDSKYIDIEPLYLSMTPYHVIVSNNELTYVWQYRTPVAKLTSVGAGGNTTATGSEKPSTISKRQGGRENVFHIDYPTDRTTPSSVVNGALGGGQQVAPGVVTAGISKSLTSDPICAITSSKTTLLLARGSGILLRFSLPHLNLEQKYVLKCRPQILALNCNSTRVSIIDINGVLTLFDLDAKPSAPAPIQVSVKNSSGVQQQQLGAYLEFERKDCWDMIWSEDNPELFACMEKTRMYVFRGIYAEEPVTSNGYLCSFNELCIKAVLLDEIITTDPEHPDREMLVNFETKSLRDSRQLLETTPIQEAYQFIEDNSHPRLWRILAESALEQLNFLIADKAFVHCNDYQGIQFVKHLKLLNNQQKQRAEVASYFKRFDEAEQIYIGIDCKELAIELRTRLGDWFRVVQLIQSGGSGGSGISGAGGSAGDGYDSLLTDAYNNIGDYYADRQKWIKAYKFYSKSKNLKSMVHCAYILDDYTALEKLVQDIPAGSEFLRDVGEKFQSVGLCSEAVRAFLKADDPKMAIDCCVLLNQWDQAVDLAEQYKFSQIEGLLTKYASYLLQKEKIFQAIELYRKANRHVEAAKLLIQLATKENEVTPAAGGAASENGAAGSSSVSAGGAASSGSGSTTSSKLNPLRIKKLYVLAALEVDRYKSKMLDQAGGTQQSTMATLQSLINHDMTMATSSANAAASSSGANGSSSSHASTDLENSWHGAEAYHFWLLAQRQLYAGQIELALRTSLRLQEYEDILAIKDIYSLISLAAFYTKYYGQCSRAFIKLEGIEIGEGESELTQEEHDKYKSLALSIFIKNDPRDPPSRTIPCPKCGEGVKDYDTCCGKCDKTFPACIATGRSLIQTTPSEVVTCRTCKHRGIEREMRKLQNCPLCHAAMNQKIHL